MKKSIKGWESKFGQIKKHSMERKTTIIQVQNLFLILIHGFGKESERVMQGNG